MVHAAGHGEVFDAGHLVWLTFGRVRQPEPCGLDCRHIAPLRVGGYARRPRQLPVVHVSSGSIIPHGCKWRPGGESRSVVESTRVRTAISERESVRIGREPPSGFPFHAGEWLLSESSGAPKSPVFTLRRVMHTSLTETTVIPIIGPRQRVCRLNRSGLEVVAWGSGIRQAGGRGSALGKDPNAVAVGLEKRRCSSSDLW